MPKKDEINIQRRYNLARAIAPPSVVILRKLRMTCLDGTGSLKRVVSLRSLLDFQKFTQCSGHFVPSMPAKIACASFQRESVTIWLRSL